MSDHEKKPPTAVVMSRQEQLALRLKGSTIQEVENSIQDIAKAINNHGCYFKDIWTVSLPDDPQKRAEVVALLQIANVSLEFSSLVVVIANQLYEFLTVLEHNHETKVSQTRLVLQPKTATEIHTYPWIVQQQVVDILEVRSNLLLNQLVVSVKKQNQG